MVCLTEAPRRPTCDQASHWFHSPNSIQYNAKLYAFMADVGLGKCPGSAESHQRRAVTMA